MAKENTKGLKLNEIKFIDLLKTYYEIKYNHYNMFMRNSKTNFTQKIYEDFIYFVNIDSVDYEFTQNFLKNITISHCKNIMWKVEIPDDFTNILDLMNYDNQVKFQTIIEYDFDDIIKLLIIFREYFKFITNNDKVMREYRSSCFGYKTPLKNKNGTYVQEIYDISKKMQDNIKNFFSCFSNDSTTDSSILSHKCVNNKSPNLNEYQCLACFILFCMFDNNNKLSNFLQTKKIDKLEKYERYLILFLSYYFCKNKEEYEYITRLMSDPLKTKVNDTLKRILYKICLISDEEREECLMDLSKKLDSLEKKHLNFEPEDFTNLYIESLLEKEEKELHNDNN